MLQLFLEEFEHYLLQEIENTRNLLETCKPEQVIFLQSKIQTLRSTLIQPEKILEKMGQDTNKERDDYLWT